MTGFSRYQKRTLAAILFTWEGFFAAGGYHVAKVDQGREPSSVSITADMFHSARTADPYRPVTRYQLTESFAIEGLACIFASGVPGFEIGRGVYHLTHSGQ